MRIGAINFVLKKVQRAFLASRLRFFLSEISRFDIKLRALLRTRALIFVSYDSLLKYNVLNNELNHLIFT